MKLMPTDAMKKNPAPKLGPNTQEVDLSKLVESMGGEHTGKPVDQSLYGHPVFMQAEKGPQQAILNNPFNVGAPMPSAESISKEICSVQPMTPGVFVKAMAAMGESMKYLHEKKAAESFLPEALPASFINLDHVVPVPYMLRHHAVDVPNALASVDGPVEVFFDLERIGSITSGVGEPSLQKYLATMFMGYNAPVKLDEVRKAIEDRVSYMLEALDHGEGEYRLNIVADWGGGIVKPIDKSYALTIEEYDKVVAAAKVAVPDGITDTEYFYAKVAGGLPAVACRIRHHHVEKRFTVVVDVTKGSELYLLDAMNEAGKYLAGKYGDDVHLIWKIRDVAAEEAVAGAASQVKVVCDESNNTPEDVAQGKLNVDVIVPTPVDHVELGFEVGSTGAKFDEVLGAEHVPGVGNWPVPCPPPTVAAKKVPCSAPDGHLVAKPGPGWWAGYDHCWHPPEEKKPKLELVTKKDLDAKEYDATFMTKPTISLEDLKKASAMYAGTPFEMTVPEEFLNKPVQAHYSVDKAELVPSPEAAKSILKSMVEIIQQDLDAEIVGQTYLDPKSSVVGTNTK